VLVNVIFNDSIIYGKEVRSGSRLLYIYIYREREREQEIDGDAAWLTCDLLSVTDWAASVGRW